MQGGMGGRALGLPQAQVSGKENSISSAVNSVNNGDKLSDAVWCDHAFVSGFYSKQGKPVLQIFGRKEGTYLVIEEGKVKLLCSTCFLKGIQIPLYD